jgi:hypothetical protein
VNLLVAFLEDRRLGLASLGALAIVVGSAMPWLYVPQPLIGNLTGYGLQDAGKITVLLGAFAWVLLLAFARLRQRDLAVGAVAAGLVAAGLAAAYALDSDRNAARVLARMLSGGSAPIDPSNVTIFPSRLGAGIWVVEAGAALLVGASLVLSFRGAGTNEPASR